MGSLQLRLFLGFWVVAGSAFMLAVVPDGWVMLLIWVCCCAASFGSMRLAGVIAKWIEERRHG